MLVCVFLDRLEPRTVVQADLVVTENREGGADHDDCDQDHAATTASNDGSSWSHYFFLKSLNYNSYTV